MVVKWEIKNIVGIVCITIVLTTSPKEVSAGFAISNVR
jgi:hypothetical protein